jgi:mannose/cellobiose epimerase-like protein (N-acyl-D-glucosamine 2-epimerase family)
MMVGLLSLFEATGCNRVLRDLEELADLLTRRAVDPDHGCLRESFRRDWRYSPLHSRDRVHVGHTLKGAWILLRLDEVTREQRRTEDAVRLLDFALRCGWDRRHLGFYDVVYRNGRRASGRKSWWAQCKGLMALSLAYRTTGESLYLDLVSKLTEFCFASLVDQEDGEWFVSCHADGSIQDDRKACEGKGAFHTVQAAAHVAATLSNPTLVPNSPRNRILDEDR